MTKNRERARLNTFFYVVVECSLSSLFSNIQSPRPICRLAYSSKQILIIASGEVVFNVWHIKEFIVGESANCENCPFE